MQEIKIGFVGAGNMAACLIGGLIADGFPRNRLYATDQNQARLDWVASEFGIETENTNAALMTHVDIVVFTVKPQVLKQVVLELSPVAKKPLYISVAAGIRTQDIEKWAGQAIALVRVMPNTPALVGSGASALFANAKTTDKQKDQAEELMRAVGVAVWVQNENDMDIVTALSGSGPAYFFLFMEALEKAATTMGLSAETARLLTLQTALGGAKLALESSDSPAILRDKVTSPGGTTEAAILSFQQNNFADIVDQALQAAKKRSEQLAHEFGGE